MVLTPENLSKALFETLPDPVLVMDSARKIIAGNAAASDVLGYSPSELTGMRLDEIAVSGAGLERDKCGSLLFRDDAQRLHRDASFRCKDGSRFPGQLTLNTVQSTDAQSTGLVALIRDLSPVFAAQEERSRTESLLNSALASISEGFVIYDEDDRLLLCNDAYREMYAACAPAMQVGASFESILRHGLANGQYPEAGETPESQDAWLSLRMERHAGSGIHFVERISADRWIQIEERITEQNYRVGLRTDVSALRNFESETERLGLILEGVAQEVQMISVKDHRVIYANKSARDNLQYSMEELDTLDARLLNADLTPDEIADQLKPLILGQVKLVVLDTRHRRKDGSCYDCRVRVERMENMLEPVLLSFGEDVTERLEFERALDRKQHEFESLVRSLPDLISRAEPDTTVKYVNEKYSKFTGIANDEMVGRKFLDFIPVESRSEVTAKIAGLTPESPIKTSERQMRDHAGRQYWYSWTNLMVFENGTPVELVSVGRDVTDSYQARERIASQSRELALRNDALEQFAGIVSHDLKAPLRQIRLFAEMIAEDVQAGKTDELEVFSGHVSERSRVMERMISSLLEYSQLAYQAISPRTFSLSEAVDAAWDNLAVNASETKARLVADVDVGVHGDLQLLTQLFQNLFANSMKYRNAATPAEIRVSVAVDGAVTSIAVEDNGIGIDPVHAENIFGVFQRLHKDEQAYSGSGIGLALCRRIAESHGGSIVLDTSYRDGARFVITLSGDAG